MNGYIIGLIAASIGAFLTMIGKYFAAKFSSQTNDIISLRKTMLGRITQAEERQAKLEQRQAKLETEVQLWTRRYWVLYRWTVKYCMKNNLDMPLPDFHDMAEEELQEAFNEIKQNSNA
jgi:hypothetical protein